MDWPHADTHSQVPGEPALWLITGHLGLRLSPLQAGEASWRYDLLKEPELPAPLKHKQVEESKWNFYRSWTPSSLRVPIKAEGSFLHIPKYNT